jgi:acetyl esterase
MVNPVLEPAAQAFAEANANPPFLFDLGPVSIDISNVHFR